MKLRFLYENISRFLKVGPDTNGEQKEQNEKTGEGEAEGGGVGDKNRHALFISSFITDIVLLLSSQAFLISSVFFFLLFLGDHSFLKQSFLPKNHFSTSTIRKCLFHFFFKYANLIYTSNEDFSTLMFNINKLVYNQLLKFTSL